MREGEEEQAMIKTPRTYRDSLETIASMEAQLKSLGVKWNSGPEYLSFLGLIPWLPRNSINPPK